MIKLDTEELQFIKMFEEMTSAHLKDFIKSEDEFIVIVKEGDMGLAIGRKGETIEKVRAKTGKKISVIEHSEDMKKFVSNIFAPVPVENVEINNGVMKITMQQRVRGNRIKRARDILKRHYNIEEITVE